MTHWIAQITAYRQTMSAQWQSRQALEWMQDKRLSAVLHAAYQTPYYKALFQQAELDPKAIARVSDLNRLPVSTKRDLQDHALVDRLARNVGPERLRSETSSGSTGAPFTVYFDNHYYRTRSFVFLRALRAVGYRPGQRVLLITQARPGKQKRRWLNWRYASIEDSPEVLAEIYTQFRPHLLYGCTTALRLLAEHGFSAQGAPWSSNTVVTTAEGIDSGTRCLLETTFGAPVYDFYGLSEIGLVAWQCPTSGAYHMAEDLVFPELLPTAKAQQSARLVLTNLAQRVMPFIRYDTGDLCVPHAGPCACGRTFSLIHRFEGREIDCIVLSSGLKVSPYRLTCAFEKLENINRFRICQQDYTRFTVLLETSVRDSATLIKRTKNRLNKALGTEVQVTVHLVPKLEHQPGRKFRVVESSLGSNRRDPKEPP